jgi:hypothetical protein
METSEDANGDDGGAGIGTLEQGPNGIEGRQCTLSSQCLQRLIAQRLVLAHGQHLDQRGGYVGLVYLS